MGRWLARIATAASLGFLWMLSLCSAAVAGTTQPPTTDNGFYGFDIRVFDPQFEQFLHSATRVMFYVVVGLIITFALTLIGLVVYPRRPDNGSRFRRSRSW